MPAPFGDYGNFVKELEDLSYENPCLKFSSFNIVCLSAFSFRKASCSSEDCTLQKESLSVVFLCRVDARDFQWLFLKQRCQLCCEYSSSTSLILFRKIS